MEWGCGCVCVEVLSEYLLCWWIGVLVIWVLRWNVVLGCVVCWFLCGVLKVGRYGVDWWM